jgi:hypothetical protein
MKKYQFRPGFAWKVDPELAGKTIEKLAEKTDGQVTPLMVLREAEKKNSPLHSCFDWNNSEAAEKWRIHQARLLMGSLIVNIEYSEPQTIRAFVNIQTPERQSYYPINMIMDDKEMMQMVIDQLKRKLTIISKQLKVYEGMRKHAEKIDQLLLQM